MKAPRPITFTNTRDDPVRVLTCLDWERRTPGPSFLVMPGQATEVTLYIAGFYIEQQRA